MVEKITSEGELLAIIVRREFSQEGIQFFTENHLSQQLAYMHHSAGKLIAPHVHNRVSRHVEYTQEVLVLKRGVLRVDFYTDTQTYLFSRTLRGGDIILLVKGGHGFEVLEEVEMYEIKQGPYVGEQDKIRFEYRPEVIGATS